MKNNRLAKIGQNLRLTGQGSLAAAAMKAGAAPGAGSAKPKYKPLAVLKGLETDELLSGKDLNRGARALTALELRPQVHGYKQLAKQLGRERKEEVAGLGKLGNELQGNVTDVYKNIAASSAQNLAALGAAGNELNSQATQIANSGSAELAGMQTGQLGDFTKALEQRGAPGGGSAQQALANAVNAQQMNQVENNQASKQLAAQQGSSYTQLGAGLAGAAQLQGGAGVAGIGREVTSRAGQANQKYRESIQTALGKLADVKATKGAVFNKNLLDLRDREQKFSLGKAAVQSEKAKMKLEEQENSEDRREDARDNKRMWAEYGLDQWKAHHPNAGSNDVREKKQEIKADKREVRSLLNTIIGADRRPKSKKEVNALIMALNGKAEADPTVVAAVVNQWWKGIHQGNRGVPGATQVPYAP